MNTKKAFAFGFISGIACVGLVLLGWAIIASKRVEQLGQAREAAILSKSAPILEPPPIPTEPRPAAYRPVLEAWSLAEVTGDATLRLPASDGKTRVITQWATWCAPCRAEMPSLETLSQDLPPEIELFLFTTEDSGPVERFLVRNSTKLRIFRTDEGIPASIWSPGPPITHVVDCLGRVTYSHLGAADWDRPEVRSFLSSVHQSCSEERATLASKGGEPGSSLAQQTRNSAS